MCQWHNLHMLPLVSTKQQLHCEVCIDTWPLQACDPWMSVGTSNACAHEVVFCILPIQQVFCHQPMQSDPVRTGLVQEAQWAWNQSPTGQPKMATMCCIHDSFSTASLKTLLETTHLTKLKQCTCCIAGSCVSWKCNWSRNKACAWFLHFVDVTDKTRKEKSVQRVFLMQINTSDVEAQDTAA